MTTLRARIARQILEVIHEDATAEAVELTLSRMLTATDVERWWDADAAPTRNVSAMWAACETLFGQAGKDFQIHTDLPGGEHGAVSLPDLYDEDVEAARTVTVDDAGHQVKHVGAAYQMFPSRLPLNYDEVVDGQAVTVERLFDTKQEADAWFKGFSHNVMTFPLTRIAPNRRGYIARLASTRAAEADSVA